MNQMPPCCLQSEDFMPVVYYYYDRADMPGTTPYETRHSHSLYEIMYVAEGAARVAVGDEQVVLRRGQYVWLSASAPHALFVEQHQPLSMLNVEYQFERADGRCPSTKALCSESADFERLLAQGAPYLVFSDPDGAAALLLRQINRWAARAEEHSRRLCSYLMTQLLLLMACAHERPAAPAGTPGNRYVAAALKRIENDYAAPLTARGMAQELFICPNYLHQLFSRHTGLTFREHLRRRRMSQARLLLSRGDMPISAVAQAVGIRSAQYFTKLFTLSAGVTPAAYRQIALNEQNAVAVHDIESPPAEE